MSTTTLTSVDRFDAEYPDELGDRLAWLERCLRISRGRILRLMGVSDADGKTWKEIAQAHEAEAERAEHLLTHYLSWFDYDTQRAADFVRDFGRKIEQGEIRLSDHVTGLATAASPEAEDEALLWSLRDDQGSNFLLALARFLADRPATADRTTPRSGASVSR